MPIVILTPANRSARIRALAERHPYMSTTDIAEMTGDSHRLVKLALGKADAEPKGVVRARPRIEARGPLSAAQIAEKTGMPLSAAKLMVK